jgi:hypothetical protein
MRHPPDHRSDDRSNQHPLIVLPRSRRAPAQTIFDAAAHPLANPEQSLAHRIAVAPELGTEGRGIELLFIAQTQQFSRALRQQIKTATQMIDRSRDLIAGLVDRRQGLGQDRFDPSITTLMTAALIGGQQFGDAFQPRREGPLAIVFGVTSIGDQEGLLRDIVNGFAGHNQGTHIGAQPGLMLGHQYGETVMRARTSVIYPPLSADPLALLATFPRLFRDFSATLPRRRPRLKRPTNVPSGTGRPRPPPSTE